jgi:hypothetical protein
MYTTKELLHQDRTAIVTGTQKRVCDANNNLNNYIPTQKGDLLGMRVFLVQLPVLKEEILECLQQLNQTNKVQRCVVMKQ